MRPPRPARPLLVCAVLLALAACTGGEPTPDVVTPTVDPGPQPEDVVVTEVVATGGIDVEVGVHPLVRTGEHVVLTLDLTPLDPVPEIGWAHVHGLDVDGLTHNLTSRAPSNVRLVDLERDVVHHLGTDAEGLPVTAPRDWDSIDDAHGVRLQIPFAAPAADVEDLSLFLPGAPLVEAVPVIDGEVPPSIRPSSATDATPTADPSATPSATADPSATSAPSPTVDPADLLDLGAVVEAPVFPLTSATAELEGAVRTVESQESVEMNLGADVLFEFDQATLTPAAQESLQLVAERLSAREPGDVLVVGHTDDHGDEGYNQDLSERRAQAVADALAGLVDTARYPMEVEGRGEAEPAVRNDSDENRALNRRVTVTLTSTVVTRTDVTLTGELPPFGDEGQVVPAGTPLRLEALSALLSVNVTARRVHDHVVVDVVVDNVGDRTTSGVKISSLSGGGSAGHEGSTTAPDATASLSVLHGATKVFPLSYTTGPTERHADGEWFPVADLTTGGGLEPGQSRTYSLVYPVLDVDSVTVETGYGDIDPLSFRILDVPVEDQG